MDDGDGGQDRQHPEHRGHHAPAVEEGPQDDEDHAFRPLHEADLAGADQGFGTGAGVADHERRDHDKGGQHDIEEAVAAGIKHQQAEEKNHVAVAIDDRIEEGSEDGDLVGLARHPSVHHVEDAGPDDDQAGVEEQANEIMLVGPAEENGGGGVDDQAQEGEHVGRNTGKRQPIHDALQEDPAGFAEGGGPGPGSLAPRRESS